MKIFGYKIHIYKDDIDKLSVKNQLLTYIENSKKIALQEAKYARDGYVLTGDDEEALEEIANNMNNVKLMIERLC